jgi:CBS domain-containing protein
MVDNHLIRLEDEVEEGHYTIRAELPGIDPAKDVDITVTDGQLTIKAERSICGDDDRLHGMITDRDIVVKCLAAGDDPSAVTAGELAQGNTYHVDATASVEEMLNMMEAHQVRRLPVMNNHRLVGIVTEADIARHLPEQAIVEFLRAICSQQAITSH